MMVLLWRRVALLASPQEFYTCAKLEVEDRWKLFAEAMRYWLAGRFHVFATTGTLGIVAQGEAGRDRQRVT